GSSGKVQPTSLLPRTCLAAIGSTASVCPAIARSWPVGVTLGQLSLTIRLTPSLRARRAAPAVHWSISITGKNGFPRTTSCERLTLARAVPLLLVERSAVAPARDAHKAG